eukprot:521673_1
MAYCICGNDLILSLPQVYGPRTVIYCNNCLSEMLPKQVIWHCVRSNIAPHRKGYDLCDLCHKSLFEKEKDPNANILEVLKNRPMPKPYDWSDVLKRNDIKYFGHGCDVQSCATSLISTINTYSANIDINFDIKEVLNNFSHLTHEHDDDEQFEIIASKLHFCDIKKCKLFALNYRDRNKEELNDQSNDYKKQIMASVHCHYFHSYDVGRRISVQDLICINQPNNDEMKYNEFDQYTKNNNIKNRGNCVLKKRKMFEKLNCCLYNRTTVKSELFNLITVEQNVFDDNIVYSFGKEFIYEPLKDLNEYQKDRALIAFKKYCSLKEELTTNYICILTSEQFDCEYKKAQMHIQSFYRKENFHTLKLEGLLAVMIYCNFDALQYKFSETYRTIHQNETNESVVKRHS